MKTLVIKDLAMTEELDRQSMAAVRGGYLRTFLPYFWGPSYSKSSTSIEAQQLIGQTQNVVNQNGNNVAFASGITSTVNPTQQASNSINVF